MSEIMQQAIDAWNMAAVRAGWRTIRLMTDGRVRKLRRILSRHGSEAWMEALGKAEASDFLCGKTERSESHQGYVFNIDTMLREDFFARLLECTFDNKETGPVYKSAETLLWEARLARWKPGALWLGIWGPSPLEANCEAPKPILDEWRARQKEMH